MSRSVVSHSCQKPANVGCHLQFVLLQQPHSSLLALLQRGHDGLCCPPKNGSSGCSPGCSSSRVGRRGSSIRVQLGRRYCNPPFQSVSQIESTVRASMLDLTNSFSGQIRVLKTAQPSEKESGCAIPKENINRTSTNVDEEHFLVLC